MGIDTIIATPAIAKHEHYNVSAYSVLDISDPANLRMPEDTDGVPLNGFTLRTGINQTFPSNIQHRIVAPLSSMFGFVDAFKNKDHEKCASHISGLVKGVVLESTRRTKVTPLCASERGTEYAFFSIPGNLERMQDKVGKEIVFLNPSRGSIERISQYGYKFDVFMTTDDEDQRKAIRNICHEKHWKVYAMSEDELTDKYLYYVSYHPQLAIRRNLKHFFGFRPNPGKCVFFRRDVTGVEECDSSYSVSYNKVDYDESYEYKASEDFTTVSCEYLSQIFAVSAQKRKTGKNGRPGYDTNITLYHDLILTFDYKFRCGYPKPATGICVPLHVKFLIAKDLTVEDNAIFGDIGGGNQLLDDLKDFPRGYELPNKPCYVNNLEHWSFLYERASFARSPFCARPVFLGFKYKYYKNKIYDIFYDKGTVVRLDPGGDINVDGKSYTKIVGVGLPLVSLLAWHKSDLMARSEYDNLINRYDVDYAVDFMSKW